MHEFKTFLNISLFSLFLRRDTPLGSLPGYFNSAFLFEIFLLYHRAARNRISIYEILAVSVGSPAHRNGGQNRRLKHRGIVIRAFSLSLSLSIFTRVTRLHSSQSDAKSPLSFLSPPCRTVI